MHLKKIFFFITLFFIHFFYFFYLFFYFLIILFFIFLFIFLNFFEQTISRVKAGEDETHIFAIPFEELIKIIEKEPGVFKRFFFTTATKIAEIFQYNNFHIEKENKKIKIQDAIINWINNEKKEDISFIERFNLPEHELLLKTYK